MTENEYESNLGNMNKNLYLIGAILRDDDTTLKVLVEKGWDLNERDANYLTALHHALFNGIKFLVWI
jgi:ankyrin repeat protein